MIWPRMNRKKEFFNYIDTHKHDVYQISLLLVGDPSAAERISMEAFHYVYDQMDNPRSTHRLYGKIVHLAMDYLNEGLMEENSQYNGKNTSSRSHTLLEESLLCLSLRERAAIVLKYTCSLPADDVQEILTIE
ncbi:hypothetical protein [Halobacillus halophilus]|uniref:hypothetical protein n=1 Tax=Halobacillus halophilus TaxID=1570 RepID=UPI001CD68B0C|nr:hypothetical protein [Halobacillus halophilus]MCA1010575.1 hypothetical protein [Halobacillus halophilus]